MNFVNTGIREVARRFRRQKNRLALANVRRTAERAEIALGRAGWRDLEGDERVHEAFETIRRHDERIAEADADIARLEAQVREQEAAREAARQEHAGAARGVEAERLPVEQTLRDLQVRQAEHARALQEQNARRAALNAEQTALLRQERSTRRQRLLLSEEDRAARQREFDAGRASLSVQAAQLTAARSGEAEAVAADQRRIKEVRDTLKGLDQRAQDADTDLAARERAVAVAIGALHKQIAAIRRQAARIEEEKNDSFLSIGHLLTEGDRPPPGQDELFAAARRHRLAYERLERLEHTWLQESRDADRQDWRIFLFVSVTLGILLLLGLLLAFRTPGKRDWLPRNTEAILTLDVKSFTDADFTRALQSQEPAAWQTVWTGLVRTVADVPAIDVRRQVSRITRALAPATEHSPAVDCLLVEMRPSVDVAALRKQLDTPAAGFRKRPQDFNGLPVYEKGPLAVAQIGPDTLAIGPPASVEALINVRLGLRDDLKSDAQVFSEFQRLDEDSAFRLVTYRPRELTDLTDPLLDSGLLHDCQSLGLTINVREPVLVVFLLNANNAAEANRIAKTLAARPDQALQLPGAFIQPPVVQTHDLQVEWRLRITDPAARELLQRVSRLELASTGGRDVAAGEP